MKIVTKPWGKEEWIELNDKYCFKRICIKSGYKTSLQYHEKKKETNYIISGEGEMWLENEKGIIEKNIIKPGDCVTIEPLIKHRIVALTDIIFHEVSTPEVDDVIRVDDDNNRGNGCIESEHKIPAVLILAAGLGLRLGDLTKYVNKALLTINNRSILSHIIDKFPKEYEIVIAIGYKGELIKEYCQIVYPDRKFIFVNVDNIDSEGSGPGHSTLQCKEYLQKPFYITVCDCLIDNELPILDGNWLGVYPTLVPEKYATIKVDSNDNIISMKNKSDVGYDLAFIGLASIVDYEIFWNKLEKVEDGELVSAFLSYSDYKNFKVKRLNWIDTGNLDDFMHAKEHFKDKPLSLLKNTGEITYKEGNYFIKFNPNKKVLNNIVKRANKLKSLIPLDFHYTNNFIRYKWMDGDSLYSLNSFEIYSKFLEFFSDNINNLHDSYGEYCKKFYIDKTKDRINQFIYKYGDKYYNQKFNINNKLCLSVEEIFSKIDFSILMNTSFYENFHGDLQFDNIIYDHKNDSFYYIDWRESFGDNNEEGDIYYDLSKLYGGCIIPYDKMKDDNNIKFNEGSYLINYEYNVSEKLIEFKHVYERWLKKNNFDLNKVKLITSLIFINMSPLHDEKFGKMLWFKSIEMFNI